MGIDIDQGQFFLQSDDYGSDDDLRHKREELASYQKIISAKEQERREREAALLEKQIAEAKKRLEESKAQETKAAQTEPKKEKVKDDWRDFGDDFMNEGKDKKREQERQREAAQSVAKRSSDGRYEVSSEGVITDTTTNLQWYVGPNQDTTWDQADAWVKNLTVAGGGWRLPTTDELNGIYDTSKSSNVNIDKVFGSYNTYLWVWSTQRSSSSAWIFTFNSGGRYWRDRSYSDFDRGFGVRSGRR